ncbi:ABC transporter substrate-binding protein [Brucella thiophenivorans]|uniref:NMT1/THI5 like family protein n=1 Tax=Brucella thiophenivorans TaxID=571255 RepID=A0A256G7B4_9HYPH|nr:ABC transporter substrate-binding protein [Brucella thiophenivorans]OYR22993.1 NMT1/THI5 like family protein [Brucella thiophenivorans]
MKKLIFAALTTFSLLSAPAVHATDLEPIKISYQPSLFWALPFYVATEKGWWKEVGLDATFVTFPAGAPQIAAAQANDWDVGGTGSVPAVLGAARFGLVTVGLTNDESKTNAVMAKSSMIDDMRANPESIKGKSILLTTNSTVDYAIRACLKKWNVASSDVSFVNLGQAQIISAVISDNGDMAGVWAPNTYTLKEKAGMDYLCSGADADAIVPGVLIVRPEFAKEKPELVAKFLAVFLRGVAWEKANPAEAEEMLKAFYTEGGVEVSDDAAKAEFALRPIFDLAEQIELLDRAGGPSKVDSWLTSIGAFMKDVGTITDNPAAEKYIDPRFLQMVKDDPKLAAFARKAD